MTILKKVALAVAAILCLGLPDTGAVAMTIEADSHDDMLSPFQPSENPMADVDTTLQQASQSGKLAMIILGANWCHDSIGFARHMSSDAVSRVLEDRYITTMVDVGYLEHGRDIVARFGLKAIYGTPTVLIIEPESGRLLNSDTIHRWREAAAMREGEVVRLLTSQRTAVHKKLPPSAELQKLLDEIDAFEAEQAARIYRGFSVIGPMLAADERPADFGHYWGQLRDLRYAITDDLKALREEAASRVANGEENIRLSFPSYPAFDWE